MQLTPKASRRPLWERRSSRDILPLLICAVLALAGCNDGSVANLYDGDASQVANFAGQEQRQEGDFLAYQHTVVVDVPEADLSNVFQAVTDACAADRDNQCTLLNSDIVSGEFSRASIRMRVKAAGVDPLVRLAAETGDVVRRNTSVEDLAKSIADIDKRIAILTTTRDRLLQLEERGSDDVESLIRITTELTRVQADLEDLLGRSAYQRQRVELDILNIEFVVDSKPSFWRPIGEALSSFGENLSEGLADTILAVAYLLPWSILLILVVYVLRKLWRLSRSK